MANGHLYKNAWFFGASGGIGKGIASLIFECAENVSLCDMDSYDCSKECDMSRFAEQAVATHGEPELMIVAAGYVSSGTLEQTSLPEINKIYANNFVIVALALQKFFECCSKDTSIPKSILVISSNAGLEARPSQPVYAAMKSAINSLVRSEAAAWGKYNIRINAIAPGTVAVPRNLESLKTKLSDFPRDPSRPLGRVAVPEDLRAACKFFFEPDSLITGQILVIDGGSSLV